MSGICGGAEHPLIQVAVIRPSQGAFTDSTILCICLSLIKR